MESACCTTALGHPKLVEGCAEAHPAWFDKLPMALAQTVACIQTVARLRRVTMETAFATLFFLFLQLAAFAQQAGITVTDSVGNPIYQEDHGAVKDLVLNKTVLTIRGNMIFRDTSEDIKDAELLVRSEDIFSKNIDHAYKNDMHTVAFCISRGKFFTDDNNANNLTAIIGFYKVDSKGNLGLYNGITGKLMAQVKGENLTAGNLSAIFYLMMNKYGLDKLVAANIKTEMPTTTSTNNVSETRGTIKRVWNTGADEFIWDGFSIKRKFNSADGEEWTFDGKTLKRTFSIGTNDIYTWDGKILQRRSNPNVDQFEWDGKVIKRVFNNGTDEFSIDGNTVKRVWDATGNDEWEVDGEVPVPVIAMVVLGLLSK